MPLPFPFPLTPKLRKIKKLVRDPLASIRKWCYDKKKTITTDPLKNKKKITNAKRKLTRTKNEVKKMEKAYEEDDVESAEDFLKKFAKNK